MQAANSAQVRAYNENKIRRVLLRRREATRLELSRETGLSQMTVGTVMAQLVAQGEAEQRGSVPSEGGRPSARYRYRGECHKTAVLYLYQYQARSCVRLAVYNLFGEAVYREEQYLEEVGSESFDRMLARAFERVPGIGGLAFGLPGQVEDTRILACDHPALEGERLFRHWTELYQVPVLLENDVNAAVLGYVRGLPPGDTPRLTAGVYFPGKFGPGLGLALGTHPWPGRRGFVGELHYLPQSGNWSELDYRDPLAVEEAVTPLLVSLCVFTGPERAVLYGDFFRPGSAEKIARQVERRFLGRCGLAVETRENLGPDYEAGMKCLALGQLKKRLFGDTWEED